MAKKMDEATKRRVRAGRMLLSGKGPTEVAAEVGVARQTVHTWKGVLDEGGIDALRAIGGKGRPAQLDARQLETLRRTLLDRPTDKKGQRIFFQRASYIVRHGLKGSSHCVVVSETMDTRQHVAYLRDGAQIILSCNTTLRKRRISPFALSLSKGR